MSAVQMDALEERLERERNLAAEVAAVNRSNWEDRSEGIVFGIALALAIVREMREQEQKP